MAERVGMLAAMPEEITPLLRQVGAVQKEKIAGFPLYRFQRGAREVFLVETGMGGARAAKAARALIEEISPHLLINFGFGGAVQPGLRVGDMVVAQRLVFFTKQLFSEQQGLEAALSEKLSSAIHQKAPGLITLSGTFVTTGEIVSKRSLAGLFPAGVNNPLLEMETSAVARIALEKNVPLAAIRCVSDAADEELDFAITDFTDSNMRISARKVVWALAKRPRIIPQLFRLAKNSGVAGKHLAVAILSALEVL